MALSKHLVLTASPDCIVHTIDYVSLHCVYGEAVSVYMCVQNCRLITNSKLFWRQPLLSHTLPMSYLHAKPTFNLGTDGKIRVFQILPSIDHLFK